MKPRMCSWKPALNLESCRGHWTVSKEFFFCWYVDLEEVDKDVGGGIDDQEEVTDCRE